MKKILILLAIVVVSASVASAESLFSLGATQNYSAAPKSLFGGVQARTVGDLISIIMNENITMKDNLSYASQRKSETVDNFTQIFNQFFGSDWKGVNKFGGSNTVGSSAKNDRQMVFGDTIAVQVVQQMQNGNLMVQGKKVLVNGNERMDLIVTGVVDPRWINSLGQVQSTNVANLQFALSGRGSSSRAGNEGILNRVIRYFF